MEFVKKVLIFSLIIHFGHVCGMCIPSEWKDPERRVSFPFVLQHSSEADGVKIFGEFVGIVDNNRLITIDGKEWKTSEPDRCLGSRIILKDTLRIIPKPLQSFIDSRKGFFSADEIGFHEFLHNDKGELFLGFIKELQVGGIRYYSPSKGFDDFLYKKVLPMKEVGEFIPEAETLQRLCRESFDTLITQVENIERIKRKTYCLAGVRIDYVDIDHGGEIKNKFFLLPYVFVSDGMDPGVVQKMEAFLAANTDKLPIGKIGNVDYYSMDLHDTRVTAQRVYTTMKFGYKDHPVCKGIVNESLHPDNIIAKFAHAEQRALDRLAILLPDFITAIANDPKIGGNITIKKMRIHMLVNNDSCCRCDAVIRAAIEKQGWLERLLIASIHKSVAFLESTKKITADSETGLVITAAISSVFPYNRGLPLEGMHFLSRGGEMKEEIEKKGTEIERKERSESAQYGKKPILKIYE